MAWLQVVGAFFLFFNSWGVVNTFGVYQTYYETDLLHGHSPSSISWIGTVQGFLLFLVGVIAGPVFDKAVGSFLVVFGLMMTSLSDQYYQVFLAHGVAVGIGCAFLFLPSIAIVATYFTTRRAVATGITASGGSIGSVIYPIIFRNLIDSVGFGWTTRIIGFIALGGLCISLAVMRMRLPPPKQARSLLDLSAFKEASFLIFSFGLFCAFVGLYFPFFYLPTYMSNVVHSTDDLAFYIIAILNATSVFGQHWGTIVFACLYGFFSGRFPNMSIVGTRMGMCFTFAGLGLLIGNPIAGALLDLERGAVMVTAGAAAFVWLRMLKWRDGERGKY
ncbi:MFS general substrate transporter [Aspergillus novofumigatus IBT 16806]|uniref:MFS general substrate transporter n=1 Tax=Aspergillus novofumigatus (strain IBT 16806) TaxID=1392255 RepID=A0A2I1C1G4_ASPN1|nr:MFS general substrate transporter [Aspergillus novofumigatus IBT 16806]PKX91449.1 MFS general substrate transporter [Aspergillus novofumigatus IBT 16806]